jgi:hypothetical protein
LFSTPFEGGKAVLFSNTHTLNRGLRATVVAAIAVAFAVLAAPAADAQTTLTAGCTADVEWSIGGADTVEAVNILLVGAGGDTLFTLAAATPNDSVETVDVPCIEADTLVAQLQVYAIVDEPYTLLDETVVIVAAGPAIEMLAQGGSVDENCEFTVPFSATVTDDCAPDTAEVMVTLLSENASLADMSYELVGTDTLEISGSVVVSGLTGSPALVEISVMATDNCGRMTTATDTVEVVDDTPPIVMCPSDVTVECSGIGGVAIDDPQLVDFFAAFDAQDNCDSEPALSNDAPDLFELGTTVVTFTAMDASGNSAECTASVEVVDTTPPEISLELNRSALWPPNHKFHDIEAWVTATDICDAEPTVVLEAIESNEEPNGKGDGNTNPDIQGADFGSEDTSFKLRAERSGNGDGRMYTIIYTATDLSGNSASDTATVIVPHDQRGHARASNGYNRIGTGFDEAADRIALIVPSAEDFDPMSIRLRGAQIGNIKGVVSPEEIYHGDVTADGVDDIVLVYPASTARELNLKAEGLKAKTSLHYADQTNNHFVVYDIFDLGEPMNVSLDALELVTFEDDAADTGNDTGDDTGGDSGDDGSTGEDVVTGAGHALRAALSMRPNPFNPTTTVFYAMPTAGDVSVRVYDIKGRLVQTLVNTSKPAGEYNVTWNGFNNKGEAVASGVYFLRLEAPGVSITRKAVMLK